MKQQAQANLAIGIGAISAVLIAGYFGLDYFTGKKAAAPAAAVASTPAPAESAAAAEPTTAASEDYSAAITAATDSAVSAGGENLTAEDARRIGEEVARQVAAQVAQTIVDQARGGGSTASSGGGLSEEDARRIGEEEGRRVAQEVAAATVQQALAASGGGSGSGLTAAEAEQIGMAAGRRAAKQIAASTARDVVRNEFGGTVTAKAGAPAAASGGESQPVVASRSTSKKTGKSSGAQGAGADALRAWWTAPASGDFGLMYAGQPKGETAIALLFSQQPADSGLNQNVKVYNDKGELVSGTWEAATNPRMAVLRGLQPGRYTVVVAPSLADSSGKAVNKGQHGPVYVL